MAKDDPTIGYLQQNGGIYSLRFSFAPQGILDITHLFLHIGVVGSILTSEMCIFFGMIQFAISGHGSVASRILKMSS